MTELEFLKSKALIKEGFTEFVISGEFGKVELTELLKEYKTEQLRLHVVMSRLPDSDEIRQQAQQMDEKEFDQWWWETVYKAN